VRDKHQYSNGKGKSKGWGLVQFEEREAVEKALELNDVIGIHERVIKVERSHVAAAGLVPPGMHRVNPKGDGKSTKRNQKKKEQRMPNDVTNEDGAPKNNEGLVVAREGGGKQETTQAKTSSVGILSFRPRGVDKAHVQSKAHRKVHLSLGDNESKS
jgi:RNA recognition motif-containing protein